MLFSNLVSFYYILIPICVTTGSFSTCATSEMWLWVSESMNGCGSHSLCHRWLNLSLVCLPNSVPCKRCVVVGNGGVLKNKTLGERIDSYDVIIR